MPTLLEIVQKSSDFLQAKGVESARLNAEHIIGHALGLGRMALYLQFERQLVEADLEKIRPLLKRRSQREPLQYVLGGTEWCGMKLKTDKRALIPRPETEYLVELIERRQLVAPSRILDLGTGTGCLAFALARLYPEARVTALDASADALALAAENADALELRDRVRFLQSDWFDKLPPDERFDLIVSNPPYLTEAEFGEAALEIKNFEPKSALTAPEDGCADLKKIISTAPGFLADGGSLSLETGIAQHGVLLEAARAAGFAEAESVEDLTKRPRFVFCAALTRRARR